MTRDEVCARFIESVPYTLYPFQEEALLAWFDSPAGVMVCAPTGMGKTLTHFTHPGLRHLIYISCSLQSFITDIGPLKKQFALEQLWALDMFTHTRHFETVALFSRR